MLGYGLREGLQKKSCKTNFFKNIMKIETDSFKQNQQTCVQNQQTL